VILGVFSVPPHEYNGAASKNAETKRKAIYFSILIAASTPFAHIY
jgi:hypothetical protein